MSTTVANTNPNVVRADVTVNVSLWAKGELQLLFWTRSGRRAYNHIPPSLVVVWRTTASAYHRDHSFLVSPALVSPTAFEDGRVHLVGCSAQRKLLPQNRRIVAVHSVPMCTCQYARLRDPTKFRSRFRRERECENVVLRQVGTNVYGDGIDVENIGERSQLQQNDFIHSWFLQCRKRHALVSGHWQGRRCASPYARSANTIV
mmetsp:Transcript_17365/g.37358  ORF Transcript_17365/g.37358 Transcript_17365/m.37358 type:complete len:203 (-) Transcript_17365:57-665(-)